MTDVITSLSISNCRKRSISRRDDRVSESLSVKLSFRPSSGRGFFLQERFLIVNMDQKRLEIEHNYMTYAWNSTSVVEIRSSESSGKKHVYQSFVLLVLRISTMIEKKKMHIERGSYVNRWERKGIRSEVA